MLEEAVIEGRKQNRQWAIRIKNYRDSEKYFLDKMSPSDSSFEWQRGRWSALCDLLKSEFTDDLLKEIE